MEYYISKDLVISPIQPEDCRAFADGFAAQGWHKPQSQYEGYLKEQRAGVRKVLVARWQGEAAGYVTLRPEAKAGPFAGKGWPEIVDFNVLEKFQRKGIGSRLMDCAEAEAAKTSRIVCLGVGLHSGYGPAQRMYIKRGYLFDGTGVWYQDKHLEEGAPCANDDELVLYLSKYLPKKEVRPLCKEELQLTLLIQKDKLPCLFIFYLFTGDSGLTEQVNGFLRQPSLCQRKSQISVFPHFTPSSRTGMLSQRQTGYGATGSLDSAPVPAA